MAMIHFNSSIAEKIYTKHVTLPRNKILTITHRNIMDNRLANEWSFSGKLHVTFLASAKPFKGYNVLIRALDEMWEAGTKSFVLNVFCPVAGKKPYMNVNEDGFTYEQLGDIFANTDVLVAPSIWYETFGFTVLEALSYGVPVIVSDHVGAKDIVGKGGIIVPAGDVKKLREALESLDEKTLEKYRKVIREEVSIKIWDQFVNEVYELYSII